MSQRKSLTSTLQEVEEIKQLPANFYNKKAVKELLELSKK